MSFGAWWTAFLYIYGPCMVLSALGYKRVWSHAAGLVFVILILGLALFTGLLVSFCYVENEWWHQIDDYHLRAWTSEYIDRQTTFGALLVIPYIAVVDVLRADIFFTFIHTTVAIWICQLLAVKILVSFFFGLR